MSNQTILRAFDKLVLNLFNVVVLAGLPLVAVSLFVQPIAG